MTLLLTAGGPVTASYPRHERHPADTTTCHTIRQVAQLTLVLSLVGVAIAAVMARRAHRPRSTFTRTAIALTALSFVADLTFGFVGRAAAALITLHTVAAASVVPTVAGRLARIR
jgi:uncharacterized membrane protein YoaK (UPF0700 family)